MLPLPQSRPRPHAAVAAVLPASVKGGLIWDQPLMTLQPSLRCSLLRLEDLDWKHMFSEQQAHCCWQQPERRGNGSARLFLVQPDSGFRCLGGTSGPPFSFGGCRFDAAEHEPFILGFVSVLLLLM